MNEFKNKKEEENERIARIAAEENKTKTGGDRAQEEETPVNQEMEKKTGSEKLRGSG